MSNRDYKTSARAVTRNLNAHRTRMQELIAGGMDRDVASKQAFEELMDRAIAWRKVQDAKRAAERLQGLTPTA